MSNEHQNGEGLVMPQHAWGAHGRESGDAFLLVKLNAFDGPALHFALLDFLDRFRLSPGPKAP